MIATHTAACRLPLGECSRATPRASSCRGMAGDHVALAGPVSWRAAVVIATHTALSPPLGECRGRRRRRRRARGMAGDHLCHRFARRPRCARRPQRHHPGHLWMARAPTVAAAAASVRGRCGEAASGRAHPGARRESHVAGVTRAVLPARTPPGDWRTARSCVSAADVTRWPTKPAREAAARSRRRPVAPLGGGRARAPVLCLPDAVHVTVPRAAHRRPPPASSCTAQTCRPTTGPGDRPLCGAPCSTARRPCRSPRRWPWPTPPSGEGCSAAKT